LTFEKTINESPLIITEGAVIERLRREFPSGLDRHIANAGFIYEPHKKTFLGNIYRHYIDAVKTGDLPLLIFTPTWRASPDRLRLAGLEYPDVNGDCYRFLAEIRAGYGGYSKRIFIGGLMGCSRDAYKPEEALPAPEAEAYHRTQAQALSAAGVDFLIASTLPATTEAAGMAKAMAETGCPYILSFIIRKNGELLDGTPLHEVVGTIDSLTSPKPPAGYVVNCIHPALFETAYVHETRLSPSLKSRLIGLQANTSMKSPEELDGMRELDTIGPDTFAGLMAGLHFNLGIKILGGCCGTDHRHINAIIEKIRNGGGPLKR